MKWRPVAEAGGQAGTGRSAGQEGEAGDGLEAFEERRVLSLGVCCMASKAASQPMQAIIKRLETCCDFSITVFEEEDILNEPPEKWPIVECLIAFSSKGFPLEKCVEYCKLRNPRCINDVKAQHILCSRVAMYRTMEEANVPCPDHIIVDHLNLAEAEELVEDDNFIEYRGKKINKPFVEKPEDGDRHDIWIYYPRSIGGGAKKLYRKVKDQSSDFDPNQNTVRKDGIYLYEPFLPTQGTDIKVYTVGAGYVHAEARKAPTVDGKVNRSKDGKEVRYPVVLTQGEKFMAALIVKAFRQNVCGFDILRTDGGSLVCDVNGWSFVKGNQKYYNDCATLIRKHFLDQEFGAENVNTSTTMILEAPHGEEIHDTSSPFKETDYALRESRVNRTPERLRSVIVVMRHGDRRPKEKMKFKTKQAQILKYFEGAAPGTSEVKLKTPQEMQLLRDQLEEVAAELRAQLKELEAAGAGDEKKQGIRDELQNIELVIPVLEMTDRFSGLERKVQLKASKWKEATEDSPRKVVQIQVVAKWGGELTVNGLAQAQDLGSRLRHALYPDDPTGLLRLHSSFRHDFKIYSSQEGRCQITAAAFTKGFLDLDGDIIPILVSLVTREKYAQSLLDEPVPKKLRDQVKKKIEELMLSYQDLGEVFEAACPTDHTGLREAAYRIGSPLQKLHTIRYDVLEYIQEIAASKDRTFQEMRRHQPGAKLKEGSEEEDPHEDCGDDAVPLGIQVPVGPGVQIPEDLTDHLKRKWLHLRRKEHRWRKLFEGFVDVRDPEKGMVDENVMYNTTKIPDLWDNLYYDMLTHRHYLGDRAVKKAEQLVVSIHPLNEWVCLSEYGISKEEKLRIGVDVTWRLVGKMLNDLEFMIEEDVGSIDKSGKHSLDGGASGVPRTLSGMSKNSGRPCSEVLGVPSPSGPSGPGGLSANGEAAADTPGDAAASQDPPLLGSCCGGGSPSASTTNGPPRSSAVAAADAGVCAIGGAGAGDDTQGVSPGMEAEHNGSGCGAAGSECGISRTLSGGKLPKGAWAEMASNEEGGPSRSEAASVSQCKSPRAPAEAERRSEAEEGPAGGGPMSRQVSEGRRGGADKDSVSELIPPRMARLTSSTKLTPEVRNQLKQAMRDSSDWHPRFNEQVTKLTDIKHTKLVRSRIYVTSASTMHSLFNILRHGQSATDDIKIVSGLDDVTDLNYLTHLVFRCYEQDDDSETIPQVPADPSLSPHSRLRQIAKARYRVEISMSPGVQVYKDGRSGPRHIQWPKGSELNERCCNVAPLQIIGDSIDLSWLERFLAGAVKEYGPRHEEEETDGEKDNKSDGGD